MHALVVYDSKYGNTREIAMRIGEAMRKDQEATVEVLSTADVTDLPEDIDLLVVGAPTKAHGVEATMRGFLDRLPVQRLKQLPVAVFDTRMHWPKLLSGSAAEGIARRLTRCGALMIDGPESFFVEDKEGPRGRGKPTEPRTGVCSC